MTCDKYNELTPIAKVHFIGELVHAAQSDDAIFTCCKDLIELAIRKGLFDGVVINPPINRNEDETI